MVEPQHCAYRWSGAYQALRYAACDRTVWERIPGMNLFDACPHTLLFTDAECELESSCEPGLLAFALDALEDPEEPVGREPLGREGWLYSVAETLLEHLPRPEDPPLHAWRIEGEYGDGVVVSTVRLELHEDPEEE